VGGANSQSLLVAGKYRLLDELGRGGMGTVFRAVDEGLQREVAVKFLLPEVQALPLAVELFRREARAMARISHQNVMGVMDLGHHGTADYMVNELINGTSAEQLLDAAGRRQEWLPLAEVLNILVQAAAGLAAVHEGGVIHRDVKPGNIMVEGESGRVVILDFGIGQWRELTGDEYNRSTGGTPAYMAPESLGGSAIPPEQRHLVDIYAFGVSAFELLTNCLPFDAQDWLELVAQHAEQAPVPPSELRPELPMELDAVVLRCLAKDPTARFASAENIRDVLWPLARAARRKIRPDSSTSGVRECLAPPEEVLVVVAGPEAGYRDAVYKKLRPLMKSCPVISAASPAEVQQVVDGVDQYLVVAPLKDGRFDGFALARELGPAIEHHACGVVLTGSDVSWAEQETLQQLGGVRLAGTLPRLAGLTQAVCDVSGWLGRHLGV
jgi:serine/threonine protein kinase